MGKGGVWAMNRRNVLQVLAALPFVGWMVPKKETVSIVTSPVATRTLRPPASAKEWTRIGWPVSRIQGTVVFFVDEKTYSYDLATQKLEFIKES